jgi:hypothetical protein
MIDMKFNINVPLFLGCLMSIPVIRDTGLAARPYLSRHTQGFRSVEKEATKVRNLIGIR